MTQSEDWRHPSHEQNAAYHEITMKNNHRLYVFVLVLVQTAISPALFAQSPFDGTWRVDYSQSKISPKPIIFSVNRGIYDCSSCNPQIHVDADGQDHSVKADIFDAISVRVIDPNSIEITYKQNGKKIMQETWTASSEGRVLTRQRTEYPPDGQEPFTSQTIADRVGKAAAGSNAVSGSWRIKKLSASESDLLTTYKVTGDELTMSAPTGESYTAKMDGKDYPAKGSFAYNTVSLRRINDHTIEETDKMNGKPLQIWKMTVSPDGKTMTSIATFVQTRRTSTIIARKQ